MMRRSGAGRSRDVRSREEENGLTREDIEFKSEGTTVRGWLYLPEGEGPFPGIAMAGGWSYVKEVVVQHYAKAFANRGLACVAFDYRCFGASDGEPREHIQPWWQIEDYKNALCFFEDQPKVDNDRLGVWGISYSGGHILILSATDPRVRCAVGVVPTIDGKETHRQVHGTVYHRRITGGDRRRSEAPLRVGREGARISADVEPESRRGALRVARARDLRGLHGPAEDRRAGARAPADD